MELDNYTKLYESSDMGENWALIQTLSPTLLGIRKLADGEVIAILRDAGVWKSSGWATNRATATFGQVLTPTAGGYVLPWGLDVSGSVVIATEYGIPRTNSKHVWVSTDDGDTFTPVLDLSALYPTEWAAGINHWHAVCIDPWDDDRLYASFGDVAPHGVYTSADLGDNWTLLTGGWQPTTMTASIHGIVAGSDDAVEGLYRIRRLADLRYEGLYEFNVSGWYGFAERGWRDPITNLAYVCFVASETGHAAHIAVGDGKWGHILYATDSTDLPDIANVMTIGSTLIAWVQAGGGNYLLRGTLS